MSNIVYKEDGIVLLHGDCLELLPILNEVGMSFVTDPPYGIDYQSNARRASAKFDRIQNDVVFDIEKFYELCVGLIGEAGVICSFASFKNYARDFMAIDRNEEVRIKNSIIWQKGGGGIGALKHSVQTDYELCIVADKGNTHINGKRCGSIWHVPRVTPERMLHPTEKPEGIIKKLIEKFVPAEGVVVDPFMGSGTTAVACKQLGHPCIGIELEKKYLDVTVERLRQGNLF